MSLIKYIAIAALVLFGAVLALIGILSVTHDTPVRSVIAEGDKDGPPSIEDPLFDRSMELFTGTQIDPGNSVQILLNGNGTYPQLWKDLASAQQTITVQMYYSQPGAVADTMAKYLIDRAQHKVRVLLLLDAFGSQPLKRNWMQRLKNAGVEVHWLRPLRWYTLQKAAQPKVDEVVIWDIDFDRAREAASAINGLAAPSLEEALRGADAAVIAASTNAHATLARETVDRRMPTPWTEFP